MSEFRVLDLFSGIGGFSLGLERAGMQTVAFCEQDGYARRVLRKHWPDVWLYDDVRTLTKKRLKADGLDPNVICGGFPCQDISCAGKGAGIEGERSGLWAEMFRLIREVKPLWVVAENVPALRGRGADRVLADLEGAGYAATPVVVGAVNVGAVHRRERVWIVAHAGGIRFDDRATQQVALGLAGATGGEGGPGDSPATRIGDGREDVAHAPGRGHDDVPCRRKTLTGDVRQALPHAPGTGRQARRADRLGTGKPGPGSPPQRGWWEVEPAIRRVADGVPCRVDRLRCLGNAVVPLIPELIGRAIVEHCAAPAQAEAM